MKDKKQQKEKVECQGCPVYHFNKCRVVECLRKEPPEPVPA